MKLWIDDIRNIPDDSWTHAKTVGAAIQALDLFYRDITHINLDHDISHQVSIGATSRPYPCEETFKAVARHIAVIKKYDTLAYPTIRWEPLIQIHTSNRAGAIAMKELLEEAGLHPDVTVCPPANRLEMRI